MAKILVIDDCESLLTAVVQVLRNAGYAVLSATSSQRGIELLREERVDLVITDIYMPEPDGLQVLQFARQAGLTMPIIVMSALPGPGNVFPTARHLGAVFTLHKPLTAERLLELVDAALDRTRGSCHAKSSSDTESPQKFVR